MDETPKGWYVQYIDRDPETIRRQEELARKKKHDLDDEERSAKFIEEQVRRGKGGKEEEVSTGAEDGPCQSHGEVTHLPFILKETPVYTELKRESEEEKGETEGGREGRPGGGGSPPHASITAVCSSCSGVQPRCFFLRRRSIKNQVLKHNLR